MLPATARSRPGRGAHRLGRLAASGASGLRPGDMHPLVTFDRHDTDAEASGGISFDDDDDDEVMEAALGLAGTVTGDQGTARSCPGTWPSSWGSRCCG